ncbi:hypothetical protein [Streptomyces sp. BF23-18]
MIAQVMMAPEAVEWATAALRGEQWRHRIAAAGAALEALLWTLTRS